MTESGKDITTAMTRLTRRMNVYVISRYTSVSTLWGIGIAVIVISISKFVTIPVPQIVAIVLLVSLAVGVIRAKMARVSALKAAMTADAQLDLKERLSSAVELLKKTSRKEMAQLQLEDAADYARSLNPKSVCPRVFPTTAKLLPLAVLILIFLMFVPSRYGRSAQVPVEVRQAIEQAGAEMETTAGEIDEESLSAATAELVKKMKVAGSELQDKSLTKKEALKRLSNLAREMEALKMMGQVADELAGDMTPEKRRILNELMEKLVDDLRDFQGMEGLSQEIMKALQANLSPETLKELSAMLQQMNIGESETKALRQMAEQVAKGKRDVAQSMAGMFRRPMDMGESDLTRAEEESGLMGSTSPGKKSAEDMKETPFSDPNWSTPSGQGYDSELKGQVSETGTSVDSEIRADMRKGEASVPYEEIYVKYRDAADDAITRSKIPWTYREHVKNYFDAIKPEGK